MMEIKKIENQAEWGGWVKEHNASFAQSWDWGEILISEGKKIERLAILDDGKIVAVAQTIFNRAFGFNYAFCPKGPVEKNLESRILNLELLRNYFATKKCVFFRVEPTVIPSVAERSRGIPITGERDSATQPSASVGMTVKKTIDVNPRATTILNLEKPEEELLEKMHAKTRYNIHLAEKKSAGGRIKISSDKNFETFWNLMMETAKRDNFRLHERKHYEAIFSSGLSRQITAFQDDKPVATIVYVSFAGTTTYLFGASDYEHRQLMASYLLQWEAIKIAKKEGNKYYDFFGIAPKRTTDYRLQTTDGRHEYDEKHQYAGVTRFKLGFGGEVVEWPGTFDLIILPVRYRMYELLRRLRRLV